MERYFCKCLNIIINVNRKETRESVGKDLVRPEPKLKKDGNRLDSFFDGMLLDVRLAISGIEVAQEPLKHERPISDWLVYACLNCGENVYALHAAKGIDRVFLAISLPHGEDTLRQMRESPNYSTFLNILLFDTSNRFKNIDGNFNATTLLECSQQIHNTCKKLILQEEEAKTERIRIFSQKENQRFREFKMRGSQDKERLLKTMRNFDSSNTSMDFQENLYSTSAMEERDVSTNLLNLPARTYKAPARPAITLSKQIDSPEKVLLEPVPGFSGERRVRRNSNPKPSLKDAEKRHDSHDDILFDMEGYNNEKDCEPFFESDDESSGDATSLESSGGFSTTSRSIPGREGSKGVSRVYASSLPVPVPLFNNTRQSYDPESDDDMKLSPSLSKLAISFKQIAKSMQDSTGMFGDLPPRRTENSFCNDNFTFN